jgi:hypothetical protein
MSAEQFYVKERPAGRLSDYITVYSAARIAEAYCEQETARLKARAEAAEEAIMTDDLELAKVLHINYCQDLADSGESAWEVPAEPEPSYFDNLQDAIVFLVSLPNAETARLRAELERAGKAEAEGDGLREALRELQACCKKVKWFLGSQSHSWYPKDDAMLEDAIVKAEAELSAAAPTKKTDSPK